MRPCLLHVCFVPFQEKYCVNACAINASLKFTYQCFQQAFFWQVEAMVHHDGKQLVCLSLAGWFLQKISCAQKLQRIITFSIMCLNLCFAKQKGNDDLSLTYHFADFQCARKQTILFYLNQEMLPPRKTAYPRQTNPGQ